MFNLYKCATVCVESEAEASFTGHGGSSWSLVLFSYSSYKQLKIRRVIFAHKGKSNISFGTVKGLPLFVCIHNINIVLL